MPWIIQLYRSDPRYLELALKTKRSYEQCIASILNWSTRAGNPPASTIERRHVRSFYRPMQETPAKANAILRVLRLLLNFAVDEGIIDRNPAEKPRLVTRPPRQTVWTPAQIEAFVEAARSAKRPSMGLAVLLGANLGQREGDVLTLGWSQYDGEAIQLRQRKTAQLIRVPVVSEVRFALGETPRISPNILVSEVTARPYLEDNFRHLFREIANNAGLQDLRFMDLRRTAVVSLAEAGCSVPEIAAITGHELDRTVRILETYLPRTATMASNAIAKLEEHRKRTKLEG